jgi:selenocysteine-specific elongation factor
VVRQREPRRRGDDPAGQRVALNLTGVGRDEVARGDVIAGGDELEPTYRVDAAVQLEDRPERVAVHHGTRESPARLVELGGRYFQLRLDEPIVPRRGDRLVIRSLAPPDTLGGGVVLDPAPRRHGPSRDLLARLAAHERGEAIEEPAPPAPEKPVQAPPPLTDSALATEARLRDAGAEPPLDSELPANDLAVLRAHGRAVRLGPTMHVHPDVLARVRDTIVAAIERDGSITLARARDELGTSRKYAQVEHLDAEHVTLRRGDERVLRRRSAHA